MEESGRAWLATLDTHNRAFRDLERFITSGERHPIFGAFVVVPKGCDIVRDVQQLCTQRHYPVVDRRLGVLVGCPGSGVHEELRARLYAYHKNNDSSSIFEDAKKYLLEGRGYFISSVRPNAIQLGYKYIPDEYDVLLFPHFVRQYYSPAT